MENTKTLYDNAEQDYDLTCWYLNQRRVTELIGLSYLTTSEVRSVVGLGDFHTRVAILAAAKDALVGWMQENKPLTLGQLLLSERVVSGTIFTHYSDFYCTGLAGQESTKRRNRSHNAFPQIYCDVTRLGHDVRLRIRYRTDHLTAASSYQWLSGHRQLFVLASINREHDGEIEALPYVIASLVPNNPTALSRASSKGLRWSNRLEVFINEIESFSLAKSEPSPRERDLSLLRDTPEEEVKHAFAEIINEPTVLKDWAGERSDLFSTFVVLDSKRISTAFAFKGPAQFKPMTLASLGKNGDQIDRLFSEPADLLILQHCHTITSPVRSMMRAYANQMGNLRLFSLIDGYDTVRIFRAYSKCGFTPTRQSTSPMKP